VQTKFILLIAGFICLNGSPVFAQQKVKADAKTLDYLNKFSSDYLKSIQDKKPEMIRGYFAENIRLMPEFQKTVMGKNNALAYYGIFLARFDVQKYDIDRIELIDIGSQVVELGMFSMSLKLKSTGKEYELKGKYQNFWEKLENSKFSLITAAWNYSHQVEIAEQLKFDLVPAVDIAFKPHVAINDNISFELAALNRLSELTITQHDAGIWAQFYTDDTKLVYSNHPIYEGKKAVSEFLKTHVTHLPVFEKLDIRNDRIDNLGEYVVEYASHIAIIRSGEWSGVNTGKNVTIWRREKDCSLKIFRGMAMYD
jgi:ketosteroid isomerase-like protein